MQQEKNVQIARGTREEEEGGRKERKSKEKNNKRTEGREISILKSLETRYPVGLQGETRLNVKYPFDYEGECNRR